ncbi:MAG: AMP-binding protein, partial [Deltaproteobacteria bacterium]|nr:AMP-binding protein [Deltaproteobacteria bacterium]
MPENPHFLRKPPRTQGTAVCGGTQVVKQDSTVGLAHTSVGGHLRDAAKNWPDAPALIQSENRRVLSWGELDQRADSHACGLLRLGLRRGDKLVIWGGNRLEWVLLFCAAARIGVITVSANAQSRLDELAALLRSAKAKALFFMDALPEGTGGRAPYDGHLEIVRRLWGRGAQGRADLAPELQFVLYAGAQECPFTLPLERLPLLGGELPPAALEEAAALADPADTINIQFTSGSTGAPKGVMLSHLNLVNNSLATGRRLRLSRDDRLCLAVPLFHCFGLSSGIMCCMGCGACMVLVESFRSLKVAQTVQNYRCTALHGVPAMFVRLTRREDLGSYDFSSLRTGIIAGAPVSAKLFRLAAQRLHLPELAVAYGQTESSPGCTQSMPEDSLELRASSIGKPLDGVEMC